MTKEQNFYQALKDVFIGARIEGTGGFVNLMKLKSNYYRNIEALLKKDIEIALKKYPKFRDELFDKLHSFFSHYFTESGSIYFNSTSFYMIFIEVMTFYELRNKKSYNNNFILHYIA